jgi:hypothetical protein
VRGIEEFFRLLLLRLSANRRVCFWGPWLFLVVLRGEVAGRGPIYFVVTLRLAEEL